MFRCGQVKPTGKDAQAHQHGLLVLGEQLVRPIDQGAQGLLALLQHAATAGEQLVAVGEAGVDLGHGQSAHARSSKLQCQRNAFQTGHQFSNGRRFARVQRKARFVLLRAFHKQANGGGLRQRLQAVTAPRNGQRMHRIGLLAGNAQGLAAGRQHTQMRRGAQQGIGQVGGRLDEVLAVVEDQQTAPRLEVRADAVQQAAVRLFTHAEHLRHFTNDQGFIANGSQVNEPNAIREIRHHMRGHLQ